MDIREHCFSERAVRQQHRLPREVGGRVTFPEGVQEPWIWDKEEHGHLGKGGMDW